jgi:hypothetical protein
MYMKPFVDDVSARCEFCGLSVAVKDQDGRWSKVEVGPSKL